MHTCNKLCCQASLGEGALSKFLHLRQPLRDMQGSLQAMNPAKLAKFTPFLQMTFEDLTKSRVVQSNMKNTDPEKSGVLFFSVASTDILKWTVGTSHWLMPRVFATVNLTGP